MPLQSPARHRSSIESSQNDCRLTSIDGLSTSSRTGKCFGSHDRVHTHAHLPSCSKVCFGPFEIAEMIHMHVRPRGRETSLRQERCNLCSGAMAETRLIASVSTKRISVVFSETCVIIAQPGNSGEMFSEGLCVSVPHLSPSSTSSCCHRGCFSSALALLVVQSLSSVRGISMRCIHEFYQACSAIEFEGGD